MASRMVLSLAATVAALTGACDGAGGSIDLDRNEGLRALTVSREIPAAETVRIDPGTQILAGKDVSLTVRGRLILAAGAGPHALIAPAAGDTWAGIVVASGGTLEAHGLDLDGASTAISVEPGAVRALYDGGTITHVEHPFQVGRAAALEVTNANVVAAKSSSGVSGAFTASRLDYEKSGAEGGVIMNDAGATFDVVDSIFRGTPDAGGDYIISYGSRLVRVAYSTITGAHCAFHFDDVARFEIDHVTAGAASPTGPGDLVAWGAMLYGSGAGPNVISNSNFVSSTLNLEQLGINGPLTITNTFTTGKNEPSGDGWTWLTADVAPAPIADAKPR